MNTLTDPLPTRLLLIDDDRLDRLACRRALDRSGHTFSIVEAATAECGLRLARTGRFDCIILDHHLPDFNGLELLCDLGESTGELPAPVIMLTSGNDAMVAARALQMGASDYIVKDPGRESLEWLPAIILKILRERWSLQEKRETEEKLLEAEAKFRSLAAQIPAITYIASLEEPGKLLYVSPQAIHLGYPEEAWVNNPEGLLRWIHPNDRQQVVEQFAWTYEHHAPLHCEYRLLGPEGQAFWFLDEARVVCAEDGRALFLQGILVDITRTKEIEQKLNNYRFRVKTLINQWTAQLETQHELLKAAHDSLVSRLRGYRQIAKVSRNDKESHFRALLEATGEGIFGLAVDGCCTFVNTAAAALFGYSPRHLEGQSMLALVRDHRIDGESSDSECPLRHTLLQGMPSRFTEILRRSDGSSFAAEFSAHAIFSETGSVTGAVMVVRDVTEAQALTRKLSYEASHDALTGLLNRAEFERRVAKTLAAAREDYSEHALCFLDLDHFKAVNDTCGHAAGDQLLQSLGRLLESRLRQSDTLARLGGDEFGLLLDHCPIEQAWAIANELREAVRSFRFTWDGEEFSIGLSIGIMALNAASGEVTSVLSAADMACYTAKRRGRDRVHVLDNPCLVLPTQSIIDNKSLGRVPDAILTAIPPHKVNTGSVRVKAVSTGG